MAAQAAATALRSLHQDALRADVAEPADGWASFANAINHAVGSMGHGASEDETPSEGAPCFVVAKQKNFIAATFAALTPGSLRAVHSHRSVHVRSH